MAVAARGSRSRRGCGALAAQLGVMAVIAALTIDVVAVVIDLERLRRLRGGATLADVGLDVSADLSDAADLAIPVAVVVAGATFGWWFWCSYRRLSQAGLAQLDPVWAVLGWIVPLLNLFRPPAMMEELAVRPLPNQVPGSRATLVDWWWGLWITGAVVAGGLRLVSPDTDTGWSIWFAIALVADLALIAAAFCAIGLIAAGARRQPYQVRP